ncbi:MAG: molybdenum cofactor biosynthesis protein MoaE [Balneolaceae bacterium]|nr:molybdenum cofactor biosynthesis protein MoaE [Balneolaceae bacterium]MCH8547839.1 molybdenum cofactor biosynthesis protein MoaE [Balneolaceae bacterium]
MHHKKTENIWIQIGGELPALEEISKFVRRDHCGAVNLFEGVTRNHDSGKSVTLLSYDSYDEMALSQCEVILNRAMKEYPLGAAAIFHKTGEVPVGEVSMIVAVSTPHRKESTQAVLAIIEQIKQDVPIWKKEFFDDEGEAVWKGGEISSD